MFRPEIKVLDCTIRDGGLMNNWMFEEKFVEKVYNVLCMAGVDIMEIGYLSSESAYSRKENGPWKFCFEEDIKRIVGEKDTDMQISAMADIGRIEYEDIPEKENSSLDIIRVACYAKDTDKAIDLAHHCIDKGYEAFIQLMAVSKLIERDLDEALDDISKSRVSTVYIVDSYGALYSEQIHHLTEKYLKALPGKTIGFHGHNNQQLAFANTIEAIRMGANQLDATMYGIGRAAGNCPLELLMSFLKNPKFDLRPILDVIQNDMLALKEELMWGYHIPYMVTGTLNEHPRSAMELLKSENRNEFREFYMKLSETENVE